MGMRWKHKLADWFKYTVRINCKIKHVQNTHQVMTQEQVTDTSISLPL